MSSSKEPKVLLAARNMDFAEFVAYLKENKDAFSDARASPPHATGKKRQSMGKNKQTADSCGLLKSKKQKIHTEEGNSTLDSFVVKFPSPKPSVVNNSHDTEESASVNTDTPASSANSSSMSLKVPEVTCSRVKCEGNIFREKSSISSCNYEEQIEIDLTRSDSISSTLSSSGNN